MATDHSPSGHAGHVDTSIHQKGMRNKSPSAVEPHPKGGSVSSDKMSSAGGTRTHVAEISTLGPRSA
jgi:hypothetical protein